MTDQTNRKDFIKVEKGDNEKNKKIQELRDDDSLSKYAIFQLETSHYETL